MSILTDEQMEYMQGILKTQICKAGKRLAMSYELIYNQFPIPADFYFIMIGFLSLLAIVVLDEVYHGGSCSKQRKEYLGIENNKKKVRFDFGNSKVWLYLLEFDKRSNRWFLTNTLTTLSSSSYPSARSQTSPQTWYSSRASWKQSNSWTGTSHPPPTSQQWRSYQSIPSSFLTIEYPIHCYGQPPPQSHWKTL